MRRITDEAAVQLRFGSPEKMDWIERSLDGVNPPIRPLPLARNRTIEVAEGDSQRRRRRTAFHALLLRQAYSIQGWMPPEMLVHLERVDVEPVTGRVVITLTTGALLLDTGDKITLRGEVDDISIAEMAQCILRKGWSEVILTGDDEFRVEMSRELLSMGVEVRDCPLTKEEQRKIREAALASTTARPKAVPPPPAFNRAF